MSEKRISTLPKELDNKEKNKIDDATSNQTEDKIKEKTTYVLSTLENRTGMKRRLKRLGLTINSVAHIVAVAMIEKKMHDKIITSYKEAEKEKDTAGRELRSNIKKIKDIFGKPFIEAFFEHRIAHPYYKAAIEKTLSDDKKKKLGDTRPAQEYFNRFCRAFRALFACSSKPPNSKLIADISNLFDLTDKRQTSETIRTRIQRLP